MGLSRRMMGVTKEHYPCRAYKIIIINAPWGKPDSHDSPDSPDSPDNILMDIAHVIFTLMITLLTLRLRRRV